MTFQLRNCGVLKFCFFALIFFFQIVVSICACKCDVSLECVHANVLDLFVAFDAKINFLKCSCTRQSMLQFAFRFVLINGHFLLQHACVLLLVAPRGWVSECLILSEMWI